MKLHRMEDLDSSTVEILKSELKHVDSYKWLAFITEFILLQLPSLMDNDMNLTFS